MEYFFTLGGIEPDTVLCQRVHPAFAVYQNISIFTQALWSLTLSTKSETSGVFSYSPNQVTSIIVLYTLHYAMLIACSSRFCGAPFARCVGVVYRVGSRVAGHKAGRSSFSSLHLQYPFALPKPLFFFYKARNRSLTKLTSRSRNTLNHCII